MYLAIDNPKIQDYNADTEQRKEVVYMSSIIEKPKISIASARVNAGMKQSDLASALNVSVSTITNWENGRSEPNVNQLRKISDLSGIPMDFIFVPEES